MSWKNMKIREYSWAKKITFRVTIHNSSLLFYLNFLDKKLWSDISVYNATDWEPIPLYHPNARRKESFGRCSVRLPRWGWFGERRKIGKDLANVWETSHITASLFHRNRILSPYYSPPPIRAPSFIISVNEEKLLRLSVKKTLRLVVAAVWEALHVHPSYMPSDNTNLFQFW